MTRLYRALLRLYPSSFRQEYGEEMAATFALACADATPPGRVVLFLRVAAGEVGNALALHGAILLQDLRYAARTLGRAPGFALTVTLVTALGVGANTAAFSVADFVLVRPLPFPGSARLVRLCEGPREGGGWGCMNELSPANFRDFKAASVSFEALGAFGSAAVNLVGGGEPRRLEVAPVTADVLPLLGVRPAIGRVFEATAGDATAAILSDGLWRSQFGADPAVLGRSITLDGAPYTVIGVMPRAFHFPSRETQLWTMLTFREEDFADRTNTYIQAVGRLAPGVTFERAHVELSLVADRLARAYPETHAETGISFFRIREGMSPRFRLMLIALAGAGLCLLLLACANLANLFVARAATRGRELAVRAALGAGRERLVRQLLTESLVLTLAGGACGVLVAAAGVPLFSSLVPPTLPIDSRPAVDLRVLALAAAFTGIAGLGFGVYPALRAGTQDGFLALREGGRAGGGARQRLRAALVTVEVAMSVVLLIAAGLLIRAAWRVQAVQPGFEPRHVLTLRTALPRPRYDSPVRRGAYYARVLEGVRALPGVQEAAFVSGLPMVVTGLITGVDVPGQEKRSARGDAVSHRWVTPGYFAAMGIPLLRGRDVEDQDTRERTWAAVVSASFAERYWPGRDPIGLTFGHRGRTRAIVGVVGDVKVRGLERSSEPQIYLPAVQAPDGFPAIFDPRDLVIRHSGPVEALLPAVRAIVRAADPEQPISDVRTMEDVLAGDTASRRAQLRVIGIFTLVGIVLSAVGIYGLLAYTVSQRSQEIGVRLALGAEPASVGRLVFADGMRVALRGVVPGVVAAYAAARGMSALLFGVAPGDPATFAAAVGLTLATAGAGALLPALRAVRVSPADALKVE